MNHSGKTIESLVLSAKQYVVDTTAGWSFYTPLMAMNELYVAGMESEHVLKTRATGMAYQALVMRPLGTLRGYLARRWNVTSNDPWYERLKVDASATLIAQTPAYFAILYLNGASWKEIAVALPTGIAIGALTGRPFGMYMDWWRTKCGTKPVFEKETAISLNSDS